MRTNARAIGIKVFRPKTGTAEQGGRGGGGAGGTFPPPNIFKILKS